MIVLLEQKFQLENFHIYLKLDSNSIFGAISVTTITPIIEKLKDEIILELKALKDVLEKRIFFIEK